MDTSYSLGSKIQTLARCCAPYVSLKESAQDFGGVMAWSSFYALAFTYFTGEQSPLPVSLAAGHLWGVHLGIMDFHSGPESRAKRGIGRSIIMGSLATVVQHYSGEVDPTYNFLGYAWGTAISIGAYAALVALRKGGDDRDKISDPEPYAPPPPGKENPSPPMGTADLERLLGVHHLMSGRRERIDA
ncbi:TPA: hypothetical protein HA295_06410 [Candidatus Woesearchaeota archaeon]|nr:hypothetical protein [Candidatus Woesearchaeota archaeon]